MEKYESLKNADPKQLYDRIVVLEDEIKTMNLQKEKNLIGLMRAIEELDTVGYIHGAGSKQRGKEALIEILVENYGENYKFQYKELLKKLKEQKEGKKDGQQ